MYNKNKRKIDNLFFIGKIIKVRSEKLHQILKKKYMKQKTNIL